MDESASAPGLFIRYAIADVHGTTQYASEPLDSSPNRLLPATTNDAPQSNVTDTSVGAIHGCIRLYIHQTFCFTYEASWIATGFWYESWSTIIFW